MVPCYVLGLLKTLEATAVHAWCRRVSGAREILDLGLDCVGTQGWGGGGGSAKAADLSTLAPQAEDPEGEGRAHDRGLHVRGA